MSNRAIVINHFTGQETKYHISCEECNDWLAIVAAETDSDARDDAAEIYFSHTKYRKHKICAYVIKQVGIRKD